MTAQGPVKTPSAPVRTVYVQNPLRRPVQEPPGLEEELEEWVRSGQEPSFGLLHPPGEHVRPLTLHDQ